MNRKQRRVELSNSKKKPEIRLNGKFYSPLEAGALAERHYTLGNFEMVVTIYSHLLNKFPDYKYGYNNLGCALRDLSRYAEALTNYDKAIAITPDDETAHNNRGVALQALKQFDEALLSYDRAVALKPDYAIAWYNRSVTLLDLKRYDEALGDCTTCLGLDPYSAKAWSHKGTLLHEMRCYDDAMLSHNKAISLKQDYVEAYGNRGLTLHEMKKYSGALASYAKAITITPNNEILYRNQAITLQAMNRYADALASCDKAIALNSNYADAWCSRSIVLKNMMCFNEALTHCDKAIQLQPDNASAYNNRGDIMLSKGDMQEAEIMFRKALVLNPDFPSPLFNLAHSRKYQSFDHDDVKTIEALLDRGGTSLPDKELLHFALGKIFNDCGLYDKAWENYHLANQIINAQLNYQADALAAKYNRIIDIFDKNFLKQSYFPTSSQSPIFIVGMPRSGTTLMASILSNHNAIATAGELSLILEFANHLPKLVKNGVTWPEVIRCLTPAIASKFISDFETRLRRDAGALVPFVIDKHPLNFSHLGLISMLFPKAQIIHCIRNPVDTCLSNYFQYFDHAYDYSFDLGNTGHFYNAYVKIMKHWRNVLPLKMIEISYEDMVTDTEQMVREVLKALKLEWEDKCLNPHTNSCAVETASKWQVRQPIYKQSLERWRYYDKYLQPLIDVLNVPI